MTNVEINFDAVSVMRAAEIIGCTDRRVRQLIAEGALRFVELGPRLRVVSRVDAEKIAKKPAPTGRPRRSA